MNGPNLNFAEELFSEIPQNPPFRESILAMW
jgi:hypothetical protein